MQETEAAERAEGEREASAAAEAARACPHHGNSNCPGSNMTKHNAAENNIAHTAHIVPWSAESMQEQQEQQQH